MTVLWINFCNVASVHSALCFIETTRWHFAEKGGWAHPDSTRWFSDYAAVLAQRLGDRVQSWMTLNEPQIFI